MDNVSVHDLESANHILSCFPRLTIELILCDTVSVNDLEGVKIFNP